MKVKKVRIKNANVSRKVNNVIFKFKKAAPEICIGFGVVGVIASGVMACKATTKAGDIISEMHKNIDDINEATEKVDRETYSEEDRKKDLAMTYTKTGVEFAKLYAPSVILGVASLTAIVASHVVLKRRNIALAAAYETINKGFKAYRSRVVERFGEETDKELKYNVKYKEFEETVTNEKGKEKVVKKKVGVSELDDISDYARYFDRSCTGYTGDPEHDLMFLKMQQNYANDKLRLLGHVYLNDVYKMLGIPESRAGQVVGWVYDEEDPNGDNCIDFGIYNSNREINRDFIKGYEKAILLDFNVDGEIIDRVKY